MFATESFLPKYKDNYAAIVFSSSNYYVPYLSTSIYSLIEHASDDSNYDIFILNKDITRENRDIISNFAEKSNISVRFVSVSDFFEGKKMHTPAHITIETYFRILVPILFKQYDKILFLDSDIIIMDDIKKLYDVDIENYPLAATEESLLSAQLGFLNKEKDYEYFRNDLGIEDVDRYLQAGIMLFNIKEFRKNSYAETLLDMVMTHKYKIVEQDAFNKLFWNKYLQIDKHWNWTPMQTHMKEMNYIENMSQKIRKRYLEVKEPKIIHYADREKPWVNVETEMAHIWWNHARKTPFYEVALSRIVPRITNDSLKERFTAASAEHLPDKDIPQIAYKILKLKYKLMTVITTGKRRTRYEKKYKLFKNKVKFLKEV